MRRLFLGLFLPLSLVLGTPTLAAAVGTATPQPTWGSVSQGPTPWGGMAWDGAHLWANTGTSVTEVWPNSNSSGSAQSFQLDLSSEAAGFSNGGQATLVALDGKIYLTVIKGGPHRGIVEIDPSTSPAHVVQVFDLDSLSGGNLHAIPYTGGITVGHSIVFFASDGTLWRFTPPTGSSPAASVVQVTGTQGAVSAVAFDGSKLWVGYYPRATSLAAYDFSATTTMLGTPTVIFPPDQAVRALSVDATHVWAVEGTTVTEIDKTTGTVIHDSIPAGINPSGIASDGTWVWVVDPSTFPGQLIGLKASDPSSSTTISLVAPRPTAGGAISGVFFDGTDVWASEASDGTIEQLKLYPSAPVISAVAQTGPQAVHFSFTAPSDPGNQVSLSYELHIDGPLGPGIVASPPETSGISVSGLTAGSRYCFVMSASNGAYQVNSAPSCITLVGTTSTTTPPPNSLAATGSSSGALVVLSGASLIFGAAMLRRSRRVA